MVVCAIFAWIAYFSLGEGEAYIWRIAPWIVLDEIQFHWTIFYDRLTAVMLVVVSSVSAATHIYAVGYMSSDKGAARFVSYLSLFTFFMMMLVCADNFAQLFFGWEGVGVASYLLIGFWHSRPAASAAAMKAFIVNRVGDVGLALGIFAIFAVFGDISFAGLFRNLDGNANAVLEIGGFTLPAFETICFLLFFGAMGKSAQLGLHVWLPDAMEGPTPVSALIHAATMVTAGVFLLCRVAPLLEYADLARAVITLVGALTAIFAALVAIAQTDIKRVIAYSTCSQLGYMFFAIGSSAYQGAIFHLTTHAFFKALLFLGAGSVIHGLSGEQDLRKMGGSRFAMPVTCALMWIGSLALIGAPLTAGFYSKDFVLEAAYIGGSVGRFAFALGILAAFCTALYSTKLMIMAFYGSYRGDEAKFSRLHESPAIMLRPLFFLALGALFSGVFFAGDFIGDDFSAFWQGSMPVDGRVAQVMEAAHSVPFAVKIAPVIAGVLGLGLAFLMYLAAPSLSTLLASLLKAPYKLLQRKFYFDEIYDFLFVRPFDRLAALSFRLDAQWVDARGPGGAVKIVSALSKRASRFQTGFLYHYAFAQLAGVAFLITAIALRGWFNG